jgi:hypothetical protein
MNEPSDEKDWVAQKNRFGLWIVGPERVGGIIEVLGMGHTREEAYLKALKTKETPDGKRS